MPAFNLPLTGSLRIEQGATYSTSFILKSQNGDRFDLTNFTASAQLRHNYDDLTPSASFTCSIDTPPTSGSFSIRLNASHSALIPADCYKWSCELTNNTDVIRMFEGVADVTPEATK